MRRSIAMVAAAISANAARLIDSAGSVPTSAINDNGLVAGCAVHHGMCAVPITDPAMNAPSVASMRVLPPPAE